MVWKPRHNNNNNNNSSGNRFGDQLGDGRGKGRSKSKKGEGEGKVKQRGAGGGGSKGGKLSKDGVWVYEKRSSENNNAEKAKFMNGWVDTLAA